jgi:hypothetical protein
LRDYAPFAFARASVIVNADHGIVRAAAMLHVSDCIANRVRFAMPQPTKWQRIEALEAILVTA